MELHCSQTPYGTARRDSVFEYPMELHCSQTSKPNLRKAACVTAESNAKGYNKAMLTNFTQVFIYKEAAFPGQQ